MCDKDALHARHVAFKLKSNGIWQSKQQGFPKGIQTNFTLCMEKDKDIEFRHFKFQHATISNFISKTRHGRLCTLFDFSG